MPSLTMQNKGTFVLTFVKLKDITLVNWILKRYLTTKFSGKLLSPFPVKKSHTTESITLVESNQIIDKDNCIGHTFNDFFGNVVKNLGIVKTFSPDTNIDPIINN